MSMLMLETPKAKPCPSCGHDLAFNALTCPNCGYVTWFSRIQTMLSLPWIASTLLLAFLLWMVAS
jgi:anaerobic ribonucleoside-triphosphate reductase